jgi:gamma-glutamylcyclotransferase (GGCT)/AIG2-like uncharacterized protein YtfP
LSRPAEHALFVYGTLRDPVLQDALFGRTIGGEAAILRGWGLYCSDSDGFLFVKHSPGSVVNGQVIRLLDRELEMADAWEDIPLLYRRERVTVSTNTGGGEAWVYSRPDGQGELYAGSAISRHTREQVIAGARELRAEMEAKSLP